MAKLTKRAGMKSVRGMTGETGSEASIIALLGRCIQNVNDVAAQARELGLKVEVTTDPEDGSIDLLVGKV